MTTKRYELSDGKSHKFWQVQIDGSELHLRWGRIGTDGQSQSKSFATEQKAELEADKLIGKKTKKGYVEVATEGTDGEVAETPSEGRPVGSETKEAAEAKAPEPATSEPATSESAAGSVAESESAAPAPPADFLQPTLEPGFLDRFAPLAAAPDAAASWANLRGREHSSHIASFAEDLQAFERGLARAKADGDQERASLTERALELLRSESPPDTVEDLAILSPFRPHACFHVARAILGPRGALSVIVEGGKYRDEQRGHYDQSAGKYINERTIAPSVDEDAWNKDAAARQAIELVEALDPEELADFEAEVERVWPVASAPHRARMAVMLGSRPAWLHRFLDDPADREVAGRNAFPAARSLEDARRLVDAIAKNRFPSELQWLLKHIGPAADEILLALRKKLGSDYEHGVVQTLRSIESPAAAEAFVGLIEHRELKATAREYLERVPRFAIPALARSRKLMAERILENLVRSNPEVVEALRPHLERAEVAAIDALFERLRVDVPDAQRSELPAVLVEPPWKKKTKQAKKTKPLTLELEPRSMPEAIEWLEGEAIEVDPGTTGPQQLQARIDDHRAKLEAGIYSHGIDLYLLLRATDEALKACFNELDHRIIGWSPGEDFPKLIARVGVEGIPGLLRFAKRNASAAAEHYTRIRSPRLALFYARFLAGRSKSRGYAQTWMERFPEEAATGLIPPALGKAKQERAQAEAALAYLGQKGHAGAVGRAAKAYGDEVARAIEEVLARDPMDQLPKKTPSLPAWAGAERLPRPLLAGRERALPTSAVNHLTTMLAFSAVDPAYPGIEVAREILDPASLGEYAWGLFGAWLGADGSSKTDWAMLALAHFGGDEGARRLTPLVRKWPGEGAHARAVKALDVLEAIGTDVALMNLHGISVKLKFKGLRTKATEKIAQIAEVRGLTAEELADRLVPDFDLDERGTMVLDFGPRKFTVGFDEALKPFVLDESGKRRKELPKPGKSDGPEAKDASKTWKALKKDVRAIASQEITRLERMMCGGRRVDLEVFRRFFVEHPLVTHLARRLVWAAHLDGETRVFRVDDERAFTDADDEPVELGEAAEIGVAHPIDLDESTKAGFGELFSDHEILQPFEQLGRAVYERTDDEAQAEELTRFALSVPLGKVRGLESLGWERGQPQDAGVIWEMLKPLRGLEVRLGLDPGFSADGYDFGGTDVQKLSPLVLVARGGNVRLPFGKLGAIQFSELIRDLQIATTTED